MLSREEYYAREQERQMDSFLECGAAEPILDYELYVRRFEPHCPYCGVPGDYEGLCPDCIKQEEESFKLKAEEQEELWGDDYYIPGGYPDQWDPNDY